MLERIGIMRFGQLLERWQKGRLSHGEAAELRWMRRLYQECNQGFAVKHFHEKLVQRHDDQLGGTRTRFHLQKTGAVEPAPRRGAHRRKRPRRPMPGMLPHEDASQHRWLAGMRRSPRPQPSAT